MLLAITSAKADFITSTVSKGSISHLANTIPIFLSFFNTKKNPRFSQTNKRSIPSKCIPLYRSSNQCDRHQSWKIYKSDNSLISEADQSVIDGLATQQALTKYSVK